MSTSNPSIKRFALPWGRSKAAASSSTTSAKRHVAAEIQPSTQRPTTTVPSLQFLPMEIQDRIFDFVLTPWTMAVLSPDEGIEYDVDTDDTVCLKKVGSRMLSGPPGASLLLVCRVMYFNFRQRYGESFTGRLILGKAKGRYRRRLPNYLMTQSKLRKFYSQIHTMNMSFALDSGRFGLNFRKVFPNLCYADCIVHEGGYGPILRLIDTVEGFLIGRYDSDFRDWTRPTVNHFVGLEGRSVVPLLGGPSPWGDEKAVIDVRVLSHLPTKPKAVLGFNYRWTGSSMKLISRVVREQSTLKYWEEGISPGNIVVVVIGNEERNVPNRFNWVRASEW